MSSKYQEKKERRIERYNELAHKHSEAAESRYSSYKSISSHIPLGQPILVGHHSERGHRADIKRMDNHLSKMSQHMDTAKYYENRAQAAASNRAIDSDDPEALDKLQAKIERLEKSREFMKAANKVVLCKKTSLEEKKEKLLKMSEGTKVKNLDRILEPDVLGRRGFASYSLQSVGAEIRRLKKRIEQLKRADTFQDFSVGEVDVKLIEGQLQVHFPDKPSEEVRKLLKTYPISLKWSRYESAWVRKYTGQGAYWKQELVKALELYAEGAE